MLLWFLFTYNSDRKWCFQCCHLLFSRWNTKSPRQVPRKTVTTLALYLFKCIYTKRHPWKRVIIIVFHPHGFWRCQEKKKRKEKEKGVKLFSNFRIFHLLRQNIKKMPTLQLFTTRVRGKKKHWNQTTYRSLTGPCASLGRIPTVTARARIFRGVGSMIHLK